MQVYGDLRILTARPNETDTARVPHHLFGVADAAEAWSVGRWLGAARGVLADIAARRRPAFVVGGTGLYFRALTHGLAETPQIPAVARAESQSLYDDLGETDFRARLATADAAAAARIAPGDRQRLTRALEVHLATGRSLSDWQAATTPTLPAATWRGLVLEPHRAALYDRCDSRLVAMIDHGALDEVARLAARDLDPRLPAMKALGVVPFAAQLKGELSPAAALTQAQADTRHYAKRQLTWFRNQTPDWPRAMAATP